MTRIYVKGDIDRFNGVVTLINNGFISNIISEKCTYHKEGTSKVITWKEEYEFVLEEESLLSSVTFNNNEARFEQNGASWFSVFRGESNTEKSKDSIWERFVESIIEKFYKKYSLLEYCQKDYDISNELMASDKEKIVSFLNDNDEEGIFNNAEIYYSKNIDKNDVYDVYGATIQLSLTDDTREAVNVLGKVLFRKVKGKFVPLYNEEAKNIFENLTEIENTDSSSFKGEQCDNGPFMAALESFFNTSADDANAPAWMKNEYKALSAEEKRGGKLDICRYIYFYQEKDRECIRDLVKQGPNNVVEIKCNKAKMQSMMHVKWNPRKYIVKVNEQEVLKCTFGIGNTFNVICLLCGEKLNAIETNGVNNEETYNLSEHFELIKNCRSIRNRNCRRLCCKKNVIEFKGQKACKDCEYEDVVYRINGTAFFTKSLKFDSGNRCLTDKTLKTCPICGRTFEIDGEYCAMCKKLVDVDKNTNKEEVDKMHKDYQKYSFMFSYLVRVFSGIKRYCVEDGECIIFRLGNKYYKVNMDIPTLGYLPAPKRIDK